jgi:hypothetical protein
MGTVDPQVEALIRQGLRPEAQQAPTPMVVTINTPDGPQQVPVPLAMVIILDQMLDELKRITTALSEVEE